VHEIKHDGYRLIVRRHGKAAERSIPRLWRRIRSILRAVTKKECMNFFRHAGYE
jgi:hypothetical protein